MQELDKEGNTALIAAAASSIAGRVDCVKLLLKSGARVNSFNHKKYNALCSHIYKCKDLNKPPEKNIVLLLYVAGETLDGITIDEVVENTSCALEKRGISLRELCRESIRKYLLHLNLDQNVFKTILYLGLPKLLTKYLLFDMSLHETTECSLHRVAKFESSFAGVCSVAEI